jgi:uncharacterized spore protein YtfJ
MQVDEIVGRARESLGSKSVFGEPYEKNGVTVIPAARVMGGAGSGGEMGQGQKAGELEAEGVKGAGQGAGFGMVGSPAGAYVIKGDSVRWLPAIDVNRMMFGFQITLIVLFLVVRSIARSRQLKV